MSRMKGGKYSRKEMQKKFDSYEIPEFKKKSRGYDPQAVDRYLNGLIDAYTKMYNEYEALRKAATEYRSYKDKMANVLMEAEIAASRVLEEAEAIVKEARPAQNEPPEEFRKAAAEYRRWKEKIMRVLIEAELMAPKGLEEAITKESLPAQNEFSEVSAEDDNDVYMTALRRLEEAIAKEFLPVGKEPPGTLAEEHYMDAKQAGMAASAPEEAEAS